MKGQRHAIQPNPQLAQILRRWIGCQRFIYNAKVQEDRYFRTFARKSLQHAGQYAPLDQTFAQYKAEAPFLKEVPSQVLRNGAYRWKTAYTRFFKKLGGRPTLKKKHGRQAVLLTNELFRFRHSQQGNCYLELGTKAKPVGAVRVTLHVPIDRIPKMISVSVHAGKWFVGFAVPELDKTGEIAQYPEYTEVLEELRKYSLDELQAAVNGVDRGVVIPVCDARQVIEPRLLSQNNERLAAKGRKKARYQRKMCRQVKGSRRRERTKLRIARIERYRAQCRTNLAHQVSHRLTADASTLVVALEQLNVKGMSASVKGTLEAPGKRVRQKAGLNRSILASGWGELRGYLKYKCFKRGKLLVSVPAHHTSQECSRCGTINKAARKSQSRYACQACGFQRNADENASRVITKHAAWGIYQHLHSGQELSTSGSDKKPKPQTPVELMVSRDAIHSYHAHNREAGNRDLNLQKAG